MHTAAESSLVEDVRFAVEHTLEQLWVTDPSVTTGRSFAGRRVPLKMRVIETAYTKQHTKAQAANLELPVAPATAVERPMGTFLDQLVAKMNGAPLESIPEENLLKDESGKVRAPLQRAPEVSAQIAHAAARLLHPGPPPLRTRSAGAAVPRCAFSRRRVRSWIGSRSST